MARSFGFVLKDMHSGYTRRKKIATFPQVGHYDPCLFWNFSDDPGGCFLSGQFPTPGTVGVVIFLSLRIAISVST